MLPRLRKRGVAPPEDICEYIFYLISILMNDSPFSSFIFPGKTSISARLSAKFRQALPKNIRMYVYRCTLYSTLQNAGWKRKAGYSLSDVSAHFLRTCRHYVCNISGLLENESCDAQRCAAMPRERKMPSDARRDTQRCPRCPAMPGEIVKREWNTI